MIATLRQHRIRPAVVISGFVMLGLLCLPFDVALAHLLLGDAIPGELRAIFRRAEVFGHGYGIIGIAVTIYLLDHANRRYLPRLFFNCLAAGLSADLLKITVWRVRPRTFEAMETIEHRSATFLGTIFTSDWNWGMLFDSSRHSFPSAHTATAVAMVITLSTIYPPGRNWFVILAVFCALNRIDGGAHFASDVCWGAALGFAVVTFCYRSRHVNRCFDRWEATSRGESNKPTIPLRRSVA